MKILFLCTAHNSLSQRLYLELSSSGHDVSVEYALSDAVMIEAVALFRPDIVICPFLTARVPKQIYNQVLTLIMHPGPPGDVGPSALDWVLMGDDGSIDNADQLLAQLNTDVARPGRSHWGVTMLQAIEDFDAGPVWAFEQFSIDIDQPGLTKSALYRGPVTRAAVTATRAAISRIQHATQGRKLSIRRSPMEPYSPHLQADAKYGQLSVTDNTSFQGGKTYDRPLLKAAQRDFDVTRHTAQQISRRIRSSDSQPGVLSKVFGTSLYIYGGAIEDNLAGRCPFGVSTMSTKLLGIRDEAVCIAASDGNGVWITHVRRPKGKDPALWPKVPAVSCLRELGILSEAHIQCLQYPSTCDWSPSSWQTFQDVWVEFDIDDSSNKTAYLYFEFYNGAMSTDQCSRLIGAMDYVFSESTIESPVRAVTLMGGSYFSNGIALNVIEAADSPAEESWLNINRIDDVVHYILHEFPSRGILTIAAIRGNAAAGGVALATACDIAIAGSEVVLNPAYRAIGLYGSEYHTISYAGRCGKANADRILRAMAPMSPHQAQRVGLVDYVFPGTGAELDDYIRTHIAMLLRPCCLKRGFWKARMDLSPAALARARTAELSEMSKDFWSARSVRYHGRRFDFVRKVKPIQTPLRFAKHRRVADGSLQDEEEADTFTDVEYFRQSAEQQLLARLRDQIRDEMALSTPRRMSLAATTPLESAGLAAELAAEMKIETLFSCYYKAADEMLTPPETPLETPFETQVIIGSFFGAYEDSEKGVAVR